MLFKVLGCIVAASTIYAISVGKIYAKSGGFGQTISRGDSPKYSWVLVAIYLLLSLALVTVF